MWSKRVDIQLINTCPKIAVTSDSLVAATDLGLDEAYGALLVLSDSGDSTANFLFEANFPTNPLNPSNPSGWLPAFEGYDSFNTTGAGTAIDFNDGFFYQPVPIPGAVWLLGSDLIGLAGLRRRLINNI